jgi:hypothetical protein
MKNSVKCLVFFLTGLFSALPAFAGTEVYFNAGDRVFQNRYIVAMPDTPLIINGVIFFPNAALTNARISTVPPGVVAPHLTDLAPGAEYMMYRGVPYQVAMPNR